MREEWSSRSAFIVASIGSAIGFGNVWRFPSLVYEYGGGPFFIPYLLALFFIGIPILILEVSVGQYYQTGDAGAFGKVNKRCRGVGLSSVICSFVVTTYYAVLLVWVLRMIAFSFGGSEGLWKDVSGDEAYNWFLNTVTGLGTASGADQTGTTRIVWWNVLALFIVWIVIYLCLAFGVKWTGRIAYFTVGLPVLFLFILLIRAVTLEGSRDGVVAYIGKWDFSVLSEQPAIWSVAVSQVFFSIGVTFGIMTAYASYMKRDSPVFSNSIIIALGNSMYSIIAGFAVFGIVGYIANLEGKTVEEMNNLGGPALVFATYPLALSTLPGHGHWERLLFVTLFLLGIDSAFSFTEASVTVLKDSFYLKRFPKSAIVGIVCVLGFLGGLLFVTDTGMLWLDSVDFYVNFMMLLVGLFETLTIGWIYGIEEQIEKIGWRPVVAYAIATFGSVCIGSSLWFGGVSGAVWKGFIALFVPYAILMSLVFVLLGRAVAEKERALIWKGAMFELFLGNIYALKKDFTGVVRYIPWAWFILVKHIIPPILLILFANLASAKTSTGKSNFGNYGNLPVEYQAVGITVFSFCLFVIILGLVFPDVFQCFITSTVDEEIEDEKDQEAASLSKAEVKADS